MGHLLKKVQTYATENADTQGMGACLTLMLDTTFPKTEVWSIAMHHVESGHPHWNKVLLNVLSLMPEAAPQYYRQPWLLKMCRLRNHINDNPTLDSKSDIIKFKRLWKRDAHQFMKTQQPHAINTQSVLGLLAYAVPVDCIKDCSISTFAQTAWPSFNMQHAIEAFTASHLNDSMLHQNLNYLQLLRKFTILANEETFPIEGLLSCTP